MITFNEDQLISVVKQVFAKKKSRYCNKYEMEQKLAEEGLAPEEAKQAISLARAKEEIGMCYPCVDGVQGERCYELLTEEDGKLEDRLISAVKEVFDKTKGEFCKVDEMKRLLLEESLTPEEARQAISLSEANEVIRWCIPYTDEIRGEPCYELLTEEDRELEEELDEELYGIKRDKQREGND
jgi:hypothetical protein